MTNKPLRPTQDWNSPSPDDPPFDGDLTGKVVLTCLAGRISETVYLDDVNGCPKWLGKIFNHLRSRAD